MKKEEFHRAIRRKLSETPLAVRRGWSDTDLLAWWMQAHQEDSYLTWERASGDLWQHVRGMCSDLIGRRATS